MYFVRYITFWKTCCLHFQSLLLWWQKHISPDWYLSTLINGITYVVGSKSFWPDQLFKVKQLWYISIQSPLISTHFSHLWTSNSMRFKKYYIFLAAISIWRGFCMSGRQLLDPTTYLNTNHHYNLKSHTRKNKVHLCCHEKPCTIVLYTVLRYCLLGWEIMYFSLTCTDIQNSTEYHQSLKT
jgi:hypothetical protein